MITHLTFLFSWIFSLPSFNKRRLPIYLFSFGILFLFLALRYGYGNDYMSYYNIHTALNEGQAAWGEGDFLFKHLNLLIPNYFLLVAIQSLFYLFSVHFLIKKNLFVKYYWLAILLLLVNPSLFLLHLSAIRQTFAICFFIFAVHYATKKKLSMYLIFILIASGFHNSAVMLFPLYFFLNDKKLNKVWLMVFCGFLISLITTPVFDIIIHKLLFYFPGYGLYVEQGFTNSIRSTILSSILFVMVLFNINKLEGKEIIYGKLALISTVIAILNIKISMLSRVGMYFDIFLIVAIPLILLRLKTNASKQILCLTVLTIYGLRYLSFFDWNQVNYIYRTILQY
jgi:hypothetical protein